MSACNIFDSYDPFPQVTLQEFTSVTHIPELDSTTVSDIIHTEKYTAILYDNDSKITVINQRGDAVYKNSLDHIALVNISDVTNQLLLYHNPDRWAYAADLMCINLKDGSVMWKKRTIYNNLDFSPNGKWAVSTSPQMDDIDGRLRLFDLTNGNEIIIDTVVSQGSFYAYYSSRFNNRGNVTIGYMERVPDSISGGEKSYIVEFDPDTKQVVNRQRLDDSKPYWLWGYGTKMITNPDRNRFFISSLRSNTGKYYEQYFLLNQDFKFLGQWDREIAMNGNIMTNEFLVLLTYVIRNKAYQYQIYNLSGENIFTSKLIDKDQHLRWLDYAFNTREHLYFKHSSKILTDENMTKAIHQYYVFNSVRKKIQKLNLEDYIYILNTDNQNELILLNHLTGEVLMKNE